MSPSTRSKSASPSSPASGPATSDAAPPDATYREEDPDRAPLETIEIELEASRQRMISWAVFGTILGVLLVWRLGTVAVWTGWVLIGVGAFRAYQLVQSFMHPPGTIVVSDTKVVLPVGLYRPHPIEVTPSEVTAVYFLRRSVPWNHAAPVLVVELGAHAMLFPRDWFASEADQRHVVHALLSHRPNLVPESSAGDATSTAKVVDRASTRRRQNMRLNELVGGLVILLVGIGGTVASLSGDPSHPPMSVGAIVLGALLVWRGLSL